MSLGVDKMTTAEIMDEKVEDMSEFVCRILHYSLTHQIDTYTGSKTLKNYKDMVALKAAMERKFPE